MELDWIHLFSDDGVDLRQNVVYISFSLSVVIKKSYETRDFMKELCVWENIFWREKDEILLSFFSTSFFCVCVCLSTMMMMMMMMMTTTLVARVVLRLRIANQVGEDSCCRGGIVHSRSVCSSALLVRPNSSKALWRFRASTSNSPSGRTWPQTDTALRYIYYIYAQQDIRVCGDDHFQPHKRQYSNPKAL